MIIMAISNIFARCLRLQHFINVNNNAVFLCSNAAKHLMQSTKSRTYAMSTDKMNDLFGSPDEPNKPIKPNKRMSKAMFAYLQRAKEYDEFMKKEIAEYEIGKRHLANMMGEDPECFTQEDIDRSIEYLFPSGLFDRKARPMMKHPNEVFPSKKEAEFDETGRPFHSMFYTCSPNYYETLYKILDKIKFLNNLEDSLMKKGTLPADKDKFDTTGSTWLLKKEIEKLLLETLFDTQYEYLITSLDCLCAHPLSKHAKDFIVLHRKNLVSHTNEIEIPPLEHDSTGKPYITVKNCMRKSSRGEVTIWGNGSGNITINGHDITYFKDAHHREQDHIVVF